LAPELALEAAKGVPIQAVSGTEKSARGLTENWLMLISSICMLF